MSHDALPSVHDSSVDDTPPNSRKQSVAGVRPPPMQSGGHAAITARAHASTTINVHRRRCTAGDQ
jgi:hypothetical protein